MTDHITRKGAVLRGSVIIGLTQALSAVLGMTINMMVARLLPLEDVGSYFLLASLVQVGATIAMGGVEQSSVPLVSGAMGDAGQANVRAVIRALSLYSGATILFATALTFGLFDQIATLMGIGSTGLTIAALTAARLGLRGMTQLTANLLRSVGRLGLFGFFQVLQYNLLFCAFVGVLFLRPGGVTLVEILTWAAVAAGIGFPVALIFLLRTISGLPKGGAVAWGPLMGVTVPLWGSTAATTVLAEIHLWIAGSVGSTESAALFGAAFRVAALFSMPLLAINMAIGPKVAISWRRGAREEVEHFLRISASASTLISVIVAGAFLVVGPTSLALLFGEEFRAAWTAFLILLASRTLNAITGSPMVLMNATRSQRPALVILLSSGLVGFVVSVILAYHDPLVGVALGAAFSVVLRNLMAVLYCQRMLGINTLPYLRPSSLTRQSNRGDAS